MSVPKAVWRKASSIPGPLVAGTNMTLGTRVPRNRVSWQGQRLILLWFGGLRGGVAS